MGRQVANPFFTVLLLTDSLLPAGMAKCLDSAVAMSDGDGEMLGLLSRLAGGCGDVASPPAPASLRSPPRRPFRTWERRSEASGAELGKRERRYAGPTVIRSPGRARPGHRRARNSRQHLALSGEVPRSCVTGAGRTELSSVCRKRAENFGGSLGRADEWTDNDRDGHHRAAIPRR